MSKSPKSVSPARSKRARTRVSQGKRFELEMQAELLKMFPSIQYHPPSLKGFSGNSYVIDFIEGGTNLIEVSCSWKTQENKLYSTFCKFIDIERVNPGLKYFLIMKYLHPNYDRPIYKQCTAFGYHILHRNDISKLKELIPPKFAFAPIVFPSDHRFH